MWTKHCTIKCTHIYIYNVCFYFFTYCSPACSILLFTFLRSFERRTLRQLLHNLPQWSLRADVTSFNAASVGSDIRRWDNNGFTKGFVNGVEGFCCFEHVVFFSMTRRIVCTYIYITLLWENVCTCAMWNVILFSGRLIESHKNKCWFLLRYEKISWLGLVYDFVFGVFFPSVWDFHTTGPRYAGPTSFPHLWTFVENHHRLSQHVGMR